MQSFLQYRRLRDQSLPSPGSMSSIDKKSLPSLANRTNTGKASGDPYTLVEWDGALDPRHPRNWSFASKINVSVLVFINVFVLDWCSAADSQTSAKIAADLGVSRILKSISSAMYVFGIAIGALTAGPISETVGRNPIYIGSRVLHFGFILGTALSHNIATRVVSRFLAGLGASTILAIHGASIADVFGPEGRSSAWPIVALGSFLGTVFSPIVSGWIDQSSNISWRWGDWIALILSGSTFIITFLWLPETFAPTLLKWRAIHLRQATGNSTLRAEIELQTSFTERLGANFQRALIMTTREYIVVLLGSWLVIVYVVVFGFLQGFNFLFAETYGLSPGLVGTVFASIAVGIVLNTLMALVFARYHKSRAAKWKRDTNATEELPPEYRLISTFPVAFTFPIGLFWLGWTNYSHVSPWSGIGAVALFGFSWAGIYVGIYQYILDVYGIYAGSALASITFARYMFAGGMQIVSRSMWTNLGTHWACTLLGCLAAVLLPVPFVLFKWGHRVRDLSRFASKKTQPDGAESAVEEEKEPV